MMAPVKAQPSRQAQPTHPMAMYREALLGLLAQPGALEPHGPEDPLGDVLPILVVLEKSDTQWLHATLRSDRFPQPARDAVTALLLTDASNVLRFSVDPREQLGPGPAPRAYGELELDGQSFALGPCASDPRKRRGDGRFSANVKRGDAVACEVQLFEVAAEAAEAAGDDPTGVLRLYTEGALSEAGQAAMGEFLARYPKLRVELSQA